MPIQNAFKPDIPPWPADFLEWVAGLKHKRFRLERAGAYYVFEFDTGQHQPHLPLHAVRSTFSVISADIAKSPDWRRLIAWHIRSVRFACRRLLRPERDIESKKPRYPWA